MNIDEAIRILEYRGAPEEGPTIAAFFEAKQLAIEALKQIKQIRKLPGMGGYYILPGETSQ